MICRKHLKMFLNENYSEQKIIFLFERCSKNTKLSRFENFLEKLGYSRTYSKQEECSKCF